MGIDTYAIPITGKTVLAAGALELTEKFFSIPGTEKRYREWLKERNQKEIKKEDDNGIVESIGKI